LISPLVHLRPQRYVAASFIPSRTVARCQDIREATIARSELPREATPGSVAALQQGDGDCCRDRIVTAQAAIRCHRPTRHAEGAPSRGSRAAPD